MEANTQQDPKDAAQGGADGAGSTPSTVAVTAGEGGGGGGGTTTLGTVISAPGGTDGQAAASAAKAPKAKLPKKMILQALYGFYDDAGKLWQWVEGQIVDDVEHIKMLIERKAPAVEHKED